MPGEFIHSMNKTKEYPQHHSLHWNFNLTHDDTAETKRATLLPICWNDDAQSPPTFDTNPMHANFAESTNGACCPESKIFSISAKLQISFTIGAWVTDKLRDLKIQIIPVAVAFEDIDATDELSSVSVGAALELTDEDTTNNTYPIYNDVVITATTDQQVDMGSSQLGLTATTALEYITMDMDQLYKLLKYGSNKGKLKSCIGGIITRTIAMGSSPSPSGSTANAKARKKTETLNMKINLPSKAKFMNKKTFFGLILRIPKSGVESQWGQAVDTTAIDHLTIDFRAHFLQWNHAFNHQRIG